jgi:hypothetical protein
MDYDGRFDRILQQAELVAGWRCPQLVMFKVFLQLIHAGELASRAGGWVTKKNTGKCVWKVPRLSLPLKTRKGNAYPPWFCPRRSAGRTTGWVRASARPHPIHPPSLGANQINKFKIQKAWPLYKTHACCRTPRAVTPRRCIRRPSSLLQRTDSPSSAPPLQRTDPPHGGGATTTAASKRVCSVENPQMLVRIRIPKCKNAQIHTHLPVMTSSTEQRASPPAHPPPHAEAGGACRSSQALPPPRISMHR